MQSVGILGGGFGLYGYLPAFYNLGFKIYTLEKYSNFIQSRADLKDLINHINFLPSEKEIFANSRYLTIARDPISQHNLIRDVVEYNFEHLFLEKPLAHNLKLHEDSLNLLKVTNQSTSIFYSLTYLDWYKEITNILQVKKNQNIKVTWKIISNNSIWKNDVSKGGGLFRYYGIHFVPLFLKSKLKVENYFQNNRSLVINLKNKNKNKLQMNLSIGEINNFSINNENHVLLSSSNPFIKDIVPGAPDPRIQIVEKYLLNFDKDFFNTELKIINYIKNEL